MKKLIVLFALSLSSFAQEPAGTSSTSTLGGSSVTAGAASAKGKPLPSADKKFVKDALEGMYYVMELAGKAKGTSKLESVKALSDSLKTDLDKIWADVGTIASDRGEKIPSELSGGDKSKMDRLGKSGDRFDKEATKILSKEVEHLAKGFELAAKSASEPATKELAAKWAPTLKDAAAKADTAEKEAAKAK